MAIVKQIQLGCALLALALGSVRLAAQTELQGKLTDLHSKPVGGATVIVRNRTTGAAWRTTTAGNGSFHLESLPPGGYALEAHSAALGVGRLEEIILQGRQTRLQASLEFAPEPAELQSAEAAPAKPFRAPPPPALQTASAPLPALLEAKPAAMESLPLPLRLLPDAAAALPSPERAQLSAELPHEPLLTMTPPVAPIPALASETPPLSAEKTAAPKLTGSSPPATGAATLTPAALGSAAPAPSEATLLVVNQLWGGGAAFASGVAAIAALQPALLTLQAQPILRGPASAAATLSNQAQEAQKSPPARRWQDFLPDKAPTPDPVSESDETASRLMAQGGGALSVDGASRRLAYGATESAAQNLSPLGDAAVAELQSASGGAERQSLQTGANLMSRQGGNRFRGQGYLFNRQELWSARNPSALWMQESAPGTATTTPGFSGSPYAPGDQELSWGLGAGGPLLRDRLFWYGAFDGLRRDNPALSIVKHPDEFFAQPTNDQLQTLGARLGVSSAQALGGYSQMLETMAGLLGPAQRSSSLARGFARLDWRLGERSKLLVEANGGQRSSPGGTLTRSVAAFGNHSFAESQMSDLWLMGRWRHFWTSNLLSSVQLSLGRTLLSSQPATPSEYEKTLIASPWNRLPQMVVDSRYGFSIGNPAAYGPGSHPDERRLELRPVVEWARRKLLLQAGALVEIEHDELGALRNQTGTYHYASVENFISDALVFSKYGLSGQLDPNNQHNCDQTGRVWRDTAGRLHGLGYLPCYSYYTQSMGPTNWWLTTSNLAGFASAQWRLGKGLALTAGLRWQRQTMPTPIAKLNNPDLPQTAAMPSAGNEWGPRVGLALGSGGGYAPVLRLGYGLYFGRMPNGALLTALTQTGSANGDLNFYLRPTDNLTTGGAPPFPYVLVGQPTSMVKPGAVAFSPAFRNSRIHQITASVEETLPSRLRITVEGMLSLGRNLPVSIDSNFDPSVNPGSITYAVIDASALGPIHTPTLTVPFYASWPTATGIKGRLNPNYQQIVTLASRANSTYEAFRIKFDRESSHGLSLHGYYLYSHAMDWNPNESTAVTGNDVLDPARFAYEYGVSDLDIRHSAVASVVWTHKGSLTGASGWLANGWSFATVGQYHSGLPYSMRTAGGVAREFVASSGAAIVGLSTGMNGSGGDSRVYGVNRNAYRYPSTWKTDFRLVKSLPLDRLRELEMMAETFNLFNHRNVTSVETVGYWIESGTSNGGAPQLHFLDGSTSGSTAFGQPRSINASDLFRNRQFQFGMRLRF